MKPRRRTRPLRKPTGRERLNELIRSVSPLSVEAHLFQLIKQVWPSHRRAWPLPGRDDNRFVLDIGAFNRLEADEQINMLMDLVLTLSGSRTRAVVAPHQDVAVIQKLARGAEAEAKAAEVGGSWQHEPRPVDEDGDELQVEDLYRPEPDPLGGWAAADVATHERREDARKAALEADVKRYNAAQALRRKRRQRAKEVQRPTTA